MSRPALTPSPSTGSPSTGSLSTGSAVTRSDRRRSARTGPALVLALLMALVVAGCGIPDNTRVVSVAAGPRKDVSPGGDPTPPKAVRTDTAEKSQFLNNFLSAAAGDYDSATDEMKKFMSPAAAASFKPTSTDIKVVHEVAPPLINPDQPTAQITVRQIGTLNAFGILTLAGGNAPTSRYDVTIGPVDGQTGLFVTSVSQPALVISDTALDQFYEERTIYFWNKDHTWLVPDLRYMSKTVPKEQQPNAVLNWLINGPSDWLSPIVDPKPNGTKLVGVVPAVTNGTLQINLSSSALPADSSKDPDALDRLQKQLRWSLLPNLPEALELNVEHGPTQTYRDDNYLDSNAAYRRPSQPERFAVYDGQVRRLASSRNAAEALPVIPAAANKNVQLAAFGGAATDLLYAALVARTPSDGLELRVGAAAPGKTSALHKIGLSATVGRPVWAATPPVGTADGTVGLIPMNGRLYSFSPDGPALHLVPAGLSGVTAVAVAPDAQRIVLIAGGKLYRAVLSDDDGLQLSPATEIYTGLNSLTAVDWRDEHSLVVSGRNPKLNGHVAVMDMSIDGTFQRPRFGDLGGNPFSYVTTYPASPTQPDPGVPVAYEVTGVGGYDESSSEKISAADLAQPVPNPKPGAQVTAPFFLN